MIIENLKIYARPLVLAQLFFGFSSGLPLLLTLTTLDLWLAQAGVTKALIGTFAIVGLPYSFKFLWAPILDQVKLGALTKRLGQRRSWLVTVQLILIVTLVGLAMTDPKTQLMTVAMVAFAVAFLSATQDILIDAFRITSLKEEEYAAGSGAFVFGYRIGMLVAGAGALYIADATSWKIAYIAMAGLIFIGFITTLMVSEPIIKKQKIKSAGKWMQHALIAPLKDLMQRHQWVMVLAFIILFKMGDALLSKMASPFYIEMGFTLSEIATISKLYGTIATIIGGLIGGLVVYQWGIYRCLWGAGIIHALANLSFVWLAQVGHDTHVLTAAISMENITGGFGTTVFVAYLSSLCAKEFSATQYAILSAIMSLPRTVFASSSGVLVEQMGWIYFFVLTTVLIIPALAVLKILKPKLSVDRKNNRRI